MNRLYGIDMEQTQHSKLLSEIPPVDIVVTMGCNVKCPFLPCKYREDWGLNDPSGMDDTAFLETITLFRDKILNLRDRIQNGTL